MWWLILLLSIGIINAILTFIIFYYMMPFAAWWGFKTEYSLDPISNDFRPDDTHVISRIPWSEWLKDAASPTYYRIWKIMLLILMAFSCVLGILSFLIFLLVWLWQKHSVKKSELKTGDMKVREKNIVKYERE